MPSPCPGPGRRRPRRPAHQASIVAPADAGPPSPRGSRPGYNPRPIARRPTRPRGLSMIITTESVDIPVDGSPMRTVRRPARRPRADTPAWSSTPTSSSSPARCSGSPGGWPATASSSSPPRSTTGSSRPAPSSTSRPTGPGPSKTRASCPTADFDADIRAALDFLADHPRVAPGQLARRRLLLRRPPRLPRRAPARREGDHLLLRDRHPQRQARLRPRRLARSEPARSGASS